MSPIVHRFPLHWFFLYARAFPRSVCSAGVIIVMKQIFLKLPFLAVLSSFSCMSVDAATDSLFQYSANAQQWFADGEAAIAEKVHIMKDRSRGKARNVILFVGDGMGVSTVTAARIFAGQQKGLSGEEYQLAFDKFPYTGLSHTYNTDMQTPDSAGTMTALITGVKTRAGMLSVSEDIPRSSCEGQDRNALLSAVELAELGGMATGVVSTARITHATPAATYATSSERDWENDVELSAQAKAAGCSDIASQFAEFTPALNALAVKLAKKPGKAPAIDGPEVVLGGGVNNFFPANGATVDGRTFTGKRQDDRNLVAEWQANNTEGTFVYDTQSLERATKARRTPVFGLFSQSHMAYDSQRQAEPEAAEQPSLAAMTSAAIDLLSEHKKGYLLVVEAGRIDHAHHINNAYNALQDTVALSDAVAVAAKRTSPEDTLIIVTADHSHVFVMAGYSARGNPILDKSRPKLDGEYALDLNDQPYTTLGYLNGRGFDYEEGRHNADARYGKAVRAGRVDLEKVDTQDPGFHQETLVPLNAETHGGEDVAIFARGPGAQLVSGSNEENVIFHVMNYAAGLTEKAKRALK